MENRIIKFRAWDKRDKVMWPNIESSYDTLGDDLINDQPNYDVSSFYGYLSDPDRYIIQQFTGLLDKNGKEIYEGDIINWYGINKVLKGEVVWCEGLAKFGVEFDEDGPAYGFSKEEAEKNIEVIGNIYENPELLASNKQD